MDREQIEAWMNAVEATQFEREIGALALRALSEPVAWIRYCSDGGYEGPIHTSRMDAVRKNSGVWTPLRAAAPVRELAGEPDSKALNLLRGLHKVVADLAPHFDKPVTDENVPRWLALNSAQQAVAQFLAAPVREEAKESVSITVGGSTHTRTAQEWLDLARRDLATPSGTSNAAGVIITNATYQTESELDPDIAGLVERLRDYRNCPAGDGYALGLIEQAADALARLATPEAGEPEWLDRYRKSARPDHQACARDYDTLSTKLAQAEWDLVEEQSYRAQVIHELRDDTERVVKRAEQAEREVKDWEAIAEGRRIERDELRERAKQAEAALRREGKDAEERERHRCEDRIKATRKRLEGTPAWTGADQALASIAVVAPLAAAPGEPQ